MKARITLTRSQCLDLFAVVDLGEEKILRIHDHFSSLGNLLLSPTQLRKTLAAILPEDERAHDSIVRVTLSFLALRRERHLSTQEVIEGIDAFLKEPFVKRLGPEGYIDNWDKIKGPLGSFLEMENVEVVAKLLDLAYEYANLLQSARILTDIRPVFNEEANRICASVIAFTLRLYYDNTHGNHSISLAMDWDDVRRLQEQCTRALQKADVADSCLNNGIQVPSIISGGRREE